MAYGLFANTKQLQLLNTIRVSSREFIAFTNVTYAKEKQGTGHAGPIKVLEIDILELRYDQLLEVFWKLTREDW